MSGSHATVIVSNDTHIGPRLIEDLSAFCPKKYLEEFDRFTASTHSRRRQEREPSLNRHWAAMDCSTQASSPQEPTRTRHTTR